jgi:Cu2+-containing amine oxidase
MTEATATAVIRHPLQPLSAAEIETAVRIVAAGTNFSIKETRFISVTLKEPAKSVVYDFKEGQPFEREIIAP